MKKRLLHIGKPFAYFLLFIAIILGTIALVRYGQGYIYDRETGRIVGGGLVLVSSAPRNANLWVDDVLVNQTPYRLRRAAGDYTIRLQRDGYRSWSKVVSVREGKVIDAEYPILIPNEVETRPLAALSNPQFMSQSRNQRYLAIVEGGERERIRLVDTETTNEPEVIFTLPSTYRNWKIREVNWSAGHTTILVKATRNSESVYVSLPVGGSGSPLFLDDVVEGEITAVYPSHVDTVHYVQVGTSIFRLDRNSPEEIRRIATGVVDAAVTGESLYLLQASSGVREGMALARYLDDEVELIYDGIFTTPTGLEITTYNDELVALLHNSSLGQVTLLRGLGRDVYTETLPLRAASRLSLSPNGRFLLMQNTSRFTSYDFETGTLKTFALPNLGTNELTWYDSYHLLTTINGSASMMEFDGANREQLTVAPGGSVFGVAKQRSIYSFGENSVTGEPLLQRTDLK